MLCKQDQLCALEQQLNEIDNTESRRLYLGSLRLDLNPERKRVLGDIGIALSEYGTSFKTGMKRSTHSADYELRR
jgi:hypothetical protein